MYTDDIWAYWADVANTAFSEQKLADWLAWIRFRAALFGPLD
ncbi:hypothetical protein OKW43_000032 [Paraburkholderia sp. WC7.3g]